MAKLIARRYHQWQILGGNTVAVAHPQTASRSGYRSDRLCITSLPSRSCRRSHDGIKQVEIGQPERCRCFAKRNSVILCFRRSRRGLPRHLLHVCRHGSTLAYFVCISCLSAAYGASRCDCDIYETLHIRVKLRPSS